MGMALNGPTQRVWLNRPCWGAAQLLALLHGWEPEGTWFCFGA